MLRWLALCWLAADSAQAANVALMGSPNPQTTAVALAGGYPSDYNRVFLMDRFTRCMKTAGLWSSSDTLYNMANATQSLAVVDWIRVGQPSGTLTLVNSPNFTADTGFAGNGTSSYGDTNYAPKDGINLSQNNNAYALYSLSNQATNIQGQGSDRFTMALMGTDGSFAGRNASSGRIVYASTTTSIGYFATSRSNSTSYMAYTSNTATLATNTTLSLNVTSTLGIDVRNLIAGPTTFSTTRVAMVRMGGSIATNQKDAEQICDQRYLSAVYGGAI